MRRAPSSCIHAYPLSHCFPFSSRCRLLPPTVFALSSRAASILQTLHSLLGRARAMFGGLSIQCAHVCPSLSAVDTKLSKIGASAEFRAFGNQLLRLAARDQVILAHECSHMEKMGIAACACISYAALAECGVASRLSLFAHSSHPKEYIQRRHQAQGRGRAVKELIAR